MFILASWATKSSIKEWLASEDSDDTDGSNNGDDDHNDAKGS